MNQEIHRRLHTQPVITGVNLTRMDQGWAVLNDAFQAVGLNVTYESLKAGDFLPSFDGLGNLWEHFKNYAKYGLIVLGIVVVIFVVTLVSPAAQLCFILVRLTWTAMRRVTRSQTQVERRQMRDHYV